MIDPESAGMRPDKLLELDQTLNSHYKSVNGIVVIKNGAIVFERYNNTCGQDDTHNLTSVTKSVTSALIGIAIGAGYIKGVDQKILDFFPEYTVPAGATLKRSLTIQHLLTMTAPFAWQSSRRSEPLDRLRRQQDWIGFILDLLGRGGQPGNFQYNSLGAHLLSAIITRSTGTSAREFANVRLFRPLLMREIPEPDMKSFSSDDVFGKNVNGWIQDPEGNTTGGWGLTLTARDMARFGLLYVRRGVWDNHEILPATWIAESTAAHTNDYGYLWWLKGEGDTFTYSAAGHGGNHIYCTPGKDLVVAIVSRLAAKPLDRWMLLEKIIFPAIQ